MNFLVWYPNRYVKKIDGLDFNAVDIRSKINLYRRYYYWAARRCIFIHIPKAAGTSINWALYGRTLGHFHAEDIRQEFPGLYRKSFVFAFVRNPWDRVLSAYRFAVKGRTETMGIRNPSRYALPEFRSFECFVRDWLVYQDLSQVDYVFRPQCDFVRDASGAPIVDFIGRVESFASDLSEVEARAGLRLDVKHLNRTGEVGAYKSEYLSSDLVDIVGEIYRDDVRSFDYTF